MAFKPKGGINVFLGLLLLSMIICGVMGDETEGIDEHDAVIEFDSKDDLFIHLVERESTVVHLYSRKDS